MWPLKTGVPANIERNLVLEQRMIDNLKLLENIWLKNKLFLCGDTISIADVVAACEIEQPSKKIVFFFLLLNCNIYLYIFRNCWF